MRLPRLLNAQRAEVCRIRPTDMDLDLTLDEISQARITVHVDDCPAITLHDLMEIYTPKGSAGIFRVTGLSYSADRMVSITLLQAIDTLSDGMWDADTDTWTGTPTQLLQAVLAKQTTAYWQIGTVQCSSTINLSMRYQDLMSVVKSMLEQCHDYYLSYNFGTWPWTVSLLAKPSGIDAEFRLSRNVRTCTIEHSDQDMCNRLYLRVATGTNDTVTRYDNAASQASYGIISKSEEIESAAYPDPTVYVNRYFADHAVPYIQISIDGYELYGLTGSWWDEYSLAELCQVVLPYAVMGQRSYAVRIVSVSYPDPFDDPEHVIVNLATKPASAARTLAKTASDLSSGMSSSAAAQRDQQAQIAQNRASIIISDEKIALNARNIELNAEQIDVNAQRLNVQAEQIAINARDITTNAENITTNAQNITTNARDITTNAENITTNARNITTNAQAITTHTQTLTVHAAQIQTNADDIETNAQRITTNAQDIITNATNITTNAQNIALNAQNIALKADTVTVNASLVSITGRVSATEAAIESLRTNWTVSGTVAAGTGSFTRLLVGGTAVGRYAITMGTDFSGTFVGDAALNLFHYHSLTVDAEGNVRLGGPQSSQSQTSFNIADTAFYRSAVASARAEGVNSVTMSPTDIIRDGEDVYNSSTHNTWIYIEASASNGASATQSFSVSGANAYNAGRTTGQAEGAAGVTLPQSGMTAVTTYNPTSGNYTITVSCTLSNGATQSKGFVITPTEAIAKGWANYYDAAGWSKPSYGNSGYAQIPARDGSGSVNWFQVTAYVGGTWLGGGGFQAQGEALVDGTSVASQTKTFT